MAATHWVSRQLLQLDYMLFRHRKFAAPETVPPCWPWPFFCLLMVLMLMLFFVDETRRGCSIMRQMNVWREKQKIHTLILIKLLLCFNLWVCWGSASCECACVCGCVSVCMRKCVFVVYVCLVKWISAARESKERERHPQCLQSCFNSTSCTVADKKICTD